VSRHGHRTVVWLAGECDIATVGVITDTLDSAISLDDADLLVDLSGVTFIDAATIGVLIRGRQRLLGQSRILTLRSPSRPARRLLDLCGLTALVEPGAPGELAYAPDSGITALGRNCGRR
jgi:anti-anti-sigma factor